MSEPLYAPEYVFSTTPVIQEIDCFYCPELISPLTDEEYFVASIPMKIDSTLNFHTRCFEEFAWLMLTYFHHYVHRDTELLVN